MRLVASVCVCVPIYVYMWQKNWLFEVLPLENLSLMQYTAHLSSLTAKKRSLLRLMIRLQKEIRKHSINGMEKGSWKIVLR